MYGKPDYDPLMDAFKCEICNKWYKGLGYHIWNKHKVKVSEYKKAYNIPQKTSLLAKEYRQERRDMVYDNGTIQNLKEGKKSQFKKGFDPRRYSK